MAAPRFRVRDISLHSRPIPYRLPFHAAGRTITAARQVLARVEIELEGGRCATGWAAECPAPIWFDKERPETATLAALYAALRRTADAYLADRRPRTAFARFASAEPELHRLACADGAPHVVASFGQALIDHAVLDALCLSLGCSFFTAMKADLVGMTTAPCPDLRDFDLPGWLAGLRPKTSLEVRHTVGLSDPLTTVPSDVPRDGLPVTLAQAITAYGLRSFKVKIDARTDVTLARLHEITALVETTGSEWTLTLDGNEVFDTVDEVRELVAAIAADPALADTMRRILYLEQPIRRDRWRSQDVGCTGLPIIIDEGEGTLDDFPHALRSGYAGVSAKTCKGVYKAVFNAARSFGRVGTFVTAEDLNHPAGLSMNQDLCVAALLGLDRVERNGHHVVDGLADTSPSVQAEFVRRHPDLYASAGGSRPRLRIDDGRVRTASLDQPGFGAAAAPDLADLGPLEPAR